MPLKIIRDDITRVLCDAIVNPTNEDLSPDGGTDAAIHEAAGPELLAACRKVRHLPVGHVAITPAYRLPARYVIHTVGPVWDGGSYGERALLEACYRNAMTLALENGCESIAFPLISSGTYGFPKDRVLKIAVSVIRDFLFSQEREMQVYLVVFDKTSYQFSERLFSDVSAYIDDCYAAARAGFFDRDECLRRSCSSLPPERRSASLRRRSRPKEAALDDEECSLAPTSIFGDDDLGSLLDSVGDHGFARTLFAYIDARGISDVACYKKANIDKKTFSKIKCNPDYRPSKPTVLAFAIALELNLAETQNLLATVGLTLSRSSKFDVIIEYFIRRGRYDIFEINETLFEFDQVLLGC